MQFIVFTIFSGDATVLKADWSDNLEFSSTEKDRIGLIYDTYFDLIYLQTRGGDWLIVEEESTEYDAFCHFLQDHGGSADFMHAESGTEMSFSLREPPQNQGTMIADYIRAFTGEAAGNVRIWLNSGATPEKVSDDT